jgi:Mrp family chromosome partitioning ATPase
VPAGSSETSPSQLICSSNAQPLFQALRQRCRFVVVDSVPVLPFAEGRALSPLADALVFVGRAGVTTREAMRRSVQLLEGVHGAPILEFVLNGADVSSSDYNYYGYGYASYKSQTPEP